MATAWTVTMYPRKYHNGSCSGVAKLHVPLMSRGARLLDLLGNSDASMQTKKMVLFSLGTIAKWQGCQQALRQSDCLQVVRELGGLPQTRTDATLRNYIKRLLARVNSSSDA
eukprot:TRINITY_DN12028_c0_g1_i2.p2 TRINITY_DN12028_c0_g1~~TRINITY_DN12028_c0_g1_i2.p2  ORF type:complete len:112 (+),score=7.34 TRINITY_DN12028_c0_g1_i2:2294-2629(+)